jgi:hypothetical protein
MYHSNSPIWQRVRYLEDLLAILARIEDRRQVIREESWNEADWARVYFEASKMGDDVEALKVALRERWAEAMGEEPAPGQDSEISSEVFGGVEWQRI